MRGVTQTREGFPHGDCVRASWATLLGCCLGDIPPLDPGTATSLGMEQGDLERAWLSSLGYDLVTIEVPPDEELPQDVLDDIPEVPHLMGGISPRGFGHRCVGVGGRLVWDPHPSRAGLVSVYSVGMVIPL